MNTVDRDGATSRRRPSTHAVIACFVKIVFASGYAVTSGSKSLGEPSADLFRSTADTDNADEARSAGFEWYFWNDDGGKLDSAAKLHSRSARGAASNAASFEVTPTTSCTLWISA